MVRSQISTTQCLPHAIHNLQKSERFWPCAGEKQKPKKVQKKKKAPKEAPAAAAAAIPPPAPHSTVNYDRWKDIEISDSDGDKDSPPKHAHDRRGPWLDPPCTCCNHRHSGDTSEDDEDGHWTPTVSDEDEENPKVYDDLSGEYIPR